AALAGLRAGAGLVSLAGTREALLAQAAHVTEVMLDEAAEVPALLAALARKRARAMVIGPAAGVTAFTRRAVLAALHERPEMALVLDADVFTAFAGRGRELFAAIVARPGPVVMTPHEGEFARLFADLAAEDAESKLERARRAAARAGCTLLLKGPDTVIVDETGAAIIEAHGPPWLATAGSGDVLSGLIGGLLAQGMAGLPAAAAAAWAHAEAARLLGAGLVAGELAAPAGRLLAALAGLPTAPPTPPESHAEAMRRGGAPWPGAPGEDGE
ncbi:MAG TPA: NAD(P)H-hydrate dehydratase, partial [Rhodospirillales bacterium]|nr:NAD(P)H-hydrate dehydratase [Rhodospirillales bacterium]